MWPNYQRQRPVWSKLKQKHSYCPSWAKVSITRGRMICLRLLALFLAGVVIGFLLASWSWSWGREDHHASTSTEIQVWPALWEQPTLLNLSNFTWLMKNQDVCKLDGRISKELPLPLMMPVLVHTARSHFAERQAIRATWGSSTYKNWFIPVVFLLGQADLGRGNESTFNQSMQEMEERELEEEQDQCGDLVIGSFVDSYRNLTYKHLMGYKWILNFCPGATFVLKTDDDAFINIPKWLGWRSYELYQHRQNSSISPPDIHCNLLKTMRPIRNQTSKLYVSNDSWPEPAYPRYCSGAGYGLTVELLKRIYLVSNVGKMLWVDDTFVTGVLMEEAKKRFNFEPVYRDLSPVKELVRGPKLEDCHNETLSRGGDIRAVEVIDRGELLGRVMMCLWNQTLAYR